jgi:hypothetical protein
LQKNPTRLRGMNFCTSLSRFAPSFVRQPNSPKCTQIVQNAPKCQFIVRWGGSGPFVAKIPTRLRGTNFCTSSARSAPSFVRQPNSLICTQIVWNTPKCSLVSYKVDRVHSLRKIPTRLRGTNFCTSLARFAQSLVRQPNGPKYTQIVRNAPTRQFSVL